MKYTLLALVIFCGIPAFLEHRSHIVADTISTALRRWEGEGRAARGVRTIRAIYELTPDQKISFNSVVVSGDGDVCFTAIASDARHQPDLVFAFMDADSDQVQYGLGLEYACRCDNRGSIDLTASVN